MHLREADRLADLLRMLQVEVFLFRAASLRELLDMLIREKFIVKMNISVTRYTAF